MAIETRIGSSAQRHTTDIHAPRVETTYLALSSLPFADRQLHPELSLGDAERAWDHAISNLLGDLIQLELRAIEGEPLPLPRMRPDVALASERCLLALEAAAPALSRRGLTGSAGPDNGLLTLERVRAICGEVASALSTDERQALRQSMQPVSQIHDEYLFIRVLQAFETTFSFVALALRRAGERLVAKDAAGAILALKATTRVLLESEPLFALLGTMRFEPFFELRQYFAAARAVQSRGFQVLGTLCRSPGASRLEALERRALPEVSERVRAGQATLAETFAFACYTERLSVDDQARVEASMTGLEVVILQWRRSHRKVGNRMLGRSTAAVGRDILQ